MEKQTELLKLQKDNERERKELKIFIGDLGINKKDVEHIFKHINLLIENELLQESLCNE